MKRYSFETAFGLGALALVWVAASVASSHLLVLVMTALIGAVYVFGTLELRQFRRETQALGWAVKQIPEGLQNLNDWLITLPAALQMPVRQRIEAERGALPGPTLTPYLVGWKGRPTSPAFALHFLNPSKVWAWLLAPRWPVWPPLPCWAS